MMIPLSLIATAIGLGLAYAAAPGAVNTEALRRGVSQGARSALLIRSRFTHWQFHVGNPRAHWSDPPYSLSRCSMDPWDREWLLLPSSGLGGIF